MIPGHTNSGEYGIERDNTPIVPINLNTSCEGCEWF